MFTVIGGDSHSYMPKGMSLHFLTLYTKRCAATAGWLCGTSLQSLGLLSDAEFFFDLFDFGCGIAVAAVIVGEVGHLVVDFDVELYFGFCSGGAD